jgi:predicted PurR-regulated permease PerM
LTEDQHDDAVREARRAATAASDRIVRLQLPPWFRTIGTGAWLLVGITALLAIVLLLATLVTQVLIPLAIAAILAAVLVPVVDRLESWRISRWLGATLVLLVGLSVVVVIVTLVIRVVVNQSGAIWAHLGAGLDTAGDQVDPNSNRGAQLVHVAQGVLRILLVGVLGSAVSSATVLLLGVVLGVFMLLFLLKDWVPITTWTAGHMGLPPQLGELVLQGTVRAFRGYALGLTLLGVVNGLVVGLGALLLGVPLAGVIALVSFVASYAPYIGACVAGAFAVFVALGANGLWVALAMLAIVLLANNTIQNLFEPFAFGRTLHLHPLVVLVTTTTGTLLFGFMGAILAAPLTSASVNAVRLLREAGTFDQATERPPGTRPAR